MNAFFLQLLGRPDAFPGRSNLDQYATGVDALLVVQLNQAAGALKRTGGIKGQTGIHLRRNHTGNQVQDFSAGEYGQHISGHGQLLGV